ncbi:MAG: hypothetical protein AAFR38_11395 [Planctomycetota bacterium]
MHRTAFAAGFALIAGAATSQTMSVVGPGDLGSDFIVDEAQTGGADLQINNGIAPFAAFEYSGLFNAGDEVSITGIALPLWANNNNATNNTLNGTFTFSFYGLGGGPNADQFDGSASETLLGEVSLDFTGQNSGVAVFGALFNSSIDFLADSSGFAVRVQSTGAFRMKLGPQPSSGRRIRIDDGRRVGVDGNQYGNLSFAGTVVPAPSVAGMIAGGLAGLSFRRRR